jgi:replicative DNA helicase
MKNNIQVSANGKIEKQVVTDKSDEEPKCEEMNLKSNIESIINIQNKLILNYRRPNRVIPFGGETLNKLEKAMNGGLFGGHLYLIGELPYENNAILINNIADNICLNEYPVLFISQDNEIEILLKTITRFSKYRMDDLNKNAVSEDELQNILKNNEISKIIKHKYTIGIKISIGTWRDCIETIMDLHKKPVTIIIDNIQKVNSRENIQNGRDRIDNSAIKIKSLAKEYNIPIIAQSMVDRTFYKDNRKFNISSFKDSGVLEYEASWCAILQGKNQGQKIDYDEVCLHVLKVKPGLGEFKDFQFYETAQKMSITEKSKSHFGEIANIF